MASRSRAARDAVLLVVGAMVACGHNVVIVQEFADASDRTRPGLDGAASDVTPSDGGGFDATAPDVTAPDAMASDAMASDGSARTDGPPEDAVADTSHHVEDAAGPDEGPPPSCPTGPSVALATTNMSYGLALSASEAFWTDVGTGTVSKVSFADCSVTTLATSQDVPVGIVLAGTYVYWTNNDAGGTSGSIVRAPQAGGAPTTLASDLYSPGNLATDGTSLFWTPDNSAMAGAVYQMPIGGGTIQSLASTQYSLGLVVTGGRVYWSDDFAGDISETLVGGGPSSVLVSGRGSTFGAATDGAHLFWLDSALNQLAIGVADAGSPLALASSSVVGDFAASLATDGENVYFSTVGTPDQILRVPVGGGSVSTMANGRAQSMAVDDTSLYWTAGASVQRLTPK